MFYVLIYFHSWYLENGLLRLRLIILVRSTKPPKNRRINSWFIFTVSLRISCISSCICVRDSCAVLSFKYPHSKKSRTVSSGEPAAMIYPIRANACHRSLTRYILQGSTVIEQVCNGMKPFFLGIQTLPSTPLVRQKCFLNVSFGPAPLCVYVGSHASASVDIGSSKTFKIGNTSFNTA